MKTFEELNIHKSQLKALRDLNLTTATPIQAKGIPALLSGQDIVGLAQTGTGKTLAYLLPILKMLPYSDQIHPRALIIVPTRELVEQVHTVCKQLCAYQNTRLLAIYGGVNINRQKEAVTEGCDIIIATPGRLFDLAASGVLRLSAIKKVVLDEVDEMLLEGFRPQLMNILDILPPKRQNILFSATLTEEVSRVIDQFFNKPRRIEIVPPGTPLERIEQEAIQMPNYYTKEDFIKGYLTDTSTFKKVLIFTKNKRMAERLGTALQEVYGEEVDTIHSNKSQNYRFQAVKKFQNGETRLLVATDIVSRGMDIQEVSHVINFDTPPMAEQYIHRIGRTGRALQSGKSLLLFSKSEEESVLEIEILMQQEIPVNPIPDWVSVSKELLPEEKDRTSEKEIQHRKKLVRTPGPAFHEKSEKNKKSNQGGSYKRKLAAKYKKPKTRGQRPKKRR